MSRLPAIRVDVLWPTMLNLNEFRPPEAVESVKRHKLG
jgi:hypothetical protein